jgi:hypothetical protein
MKFIVLLFLIFCSNLLKAQSPLSDTVYNEIRNLRKNNIDTIIRFTLPDFHDMNNSKLVGIGTVHIWEVEYLIFKKNNKVYSKKCVHYCNSDCTNIEIAFSQPMEIYLDSLFDFLNKFIKQIESEEIYPYISQIKTPQSETYVYDIIASHPEPRYLVGVYYQNEDIVKIINENALSEQLNEYQPKNLNYQSNIQTKLSVLFKNLKVVIEQKDDLYNFKKINSN